MQAASHPHPVPGPNTRTRSGQRFFNISLYDQATDPTVLPAKLAYQSYQAIRQKVRPKGEKAMRYAAYLRISSEDQIGNYSIDAQRRAIETWVQAQGGYLVSVYCDEAHSGRTDNRPAFQKMRRDARKGKFDALVVHKFDRFARNRTDALAIKSLLRYDYGVKVFSVSEPSEDSDGPIGALIEGIMECVADWYSRNLASEVAKGKQERGHQGLHNNQAPFGMKKNENKVLIPNEDELPGLILAFETYATGQYSDTEIAHLLNERGYRSKTGRLFSKDTVRDVLQNKTYLGMIRYQEYRRNASGSRSYTAPIQWFKGQHKPVIGEELFNRCQQVRAERAVHHQATPKYNPYLLRNLIYCYRCSRNLPKEASFPTFSKMRPQSQSKDEHRYYRCRARELGYGCEQRGVQVEKIDDQVVSILMQLKPPENWRKHITRAMSEILGEQNLEERLAEIHATIEHMDFRWDHGFITDEADYMQKRLQLQQELEQLTPIPDDDLERAADVLENFATHWAACEGDPEAQHKLVKLIVERVYVQDEEVVAMTLKADYHIVLGHKGNGPTEVSIDPSVYTHGSDGLGHQTGYTVRLLFGPRLSAFTTS